MQRLPCVCHTFGPDWPCQRSPASGRDFFGCTDNDLEERDAAIAASRKAYEEHRAEELSLGPPIGTSEIQPEGSVGAPLALNLNVAENPI